MLKPWAEEKWHYKWQHLCICTRKLCQAWKDKCNTVQAVLYVWAWHSVQSMLLYLKWDALYRKSTLLPPTPDLLLYTYLVQVKANNNGPKRHIVGKGYTLLNILFKNQFLIYLELNVYKYLQESSLGFHCFVFFVVVVGGGHCGVLFVLFVLFFHCLVLFCFNKKDLGLILLSHCF